MHNPRINPEREKKLPSLIYIVTYQFKHQQYRPKIDPHMVEMDILNQISKRCEGKVISKVHPQTISFNSYNCIIRKIDDEDTRTYVASIFSNRKARARLYNLDEPPSKIQQLFKAFPKNPISIYLIATKKQRKLKDSLLEFNKHSHLSKRTVTSAGVIKNQILAILKDIESTNSVLQRSLLLFLSEKTSKAVHELNIFIESIAQYASITGKLNKLFRERSVIFRHIESSEKSTQERIQDILGNIRRPPEQVKPADLGAMLTEVSGIFSRLTTITTSINRDYITARSYLHRIEEIFNLWDEKPVMNYPTNSSVEIRRFEGIVNCFSDNVDRLQALRIQLDTVLDTIRTYVGIQQQNVSLDEQRDTKKLLSRMVNLQEVLHKLEILIVAFYITEMGRLIFETIAHDIANILTIAFIPAALLLAVGIKKLLHRQE